MSTTVVAVGKKHESWVADGIARYSKRLRKPYDLTWRLLPHSAKDHDAARAEESAKILQTLKPHQHVILLDERGTNLSSPALAAHLQRQYDSGTEVAIIIGGAYGVSQDLHHRANLTWSLSSLVFPHQLVRLILTEQLYRAQEISAGRSYHHV
ncbi:23S rRNA (pseudouridine(1915)-N(3))-methyltransferase RlmH [Nesterenkonia sphaerica]|uniref:Ribosomal RNA large subunit methyltransferase H n=1 Tax=Nesterenkonia sphaerica TaxID=1804988 RepID=A0A5R9AAD6_9MICC|nr:23S rRNA (pseudouridine(1915)-N(3))-methyltransferase RlmH [Nesterenkonia sphaerica]TLP75752.1 23S rRNA (pseudouridine(1915)-N(3))-methyltransferase RlmH [Nesterenkonia sphaerica]